MQAVDIDDITPHAFQKKFLQAQQPVLIRGGARDWPAAHWKVEHLISLVASREVELRHSPSGVFNCGQFSAQKVSFGEAAQLINSEKGANYYVQQSEIASQLPELLKDIRRPRLLHRNHRHKEFLWLSGSNCKSALHFDHMDNFLSQLIGSKRLTLFPPSESANLYPALGSKFPFCSEIDIFTGNLDAFPLYSKAKTKALLVDLLPGDILFIPKRWWHAVETLETSISVNFWWHERPTFIQKILRLLRKRLYGKTDVP